ncbi:MAG TPA: MFS transporter, partial [Gemmataceae bacterium]|nr:MFS transporter [Gemmataceae bacterium]
LTSPPARGAAWKWWVCVLLLLATTINYMDRLTLNLTAKRIEAELGLNHEQYGQVEFGFGIAFALGALAFGVMADRWNVRWIYPAALLLWSAAGFATGFAWGFASLFAIRSLLGLAEAGNWPCALRTTQHILRPEQRTMGNGILQSGAAIGAIFIPLVVAALVTGPGSWRYPFFIVGLAGAAWVVVWLLSVRGADLALTPPKRLEPEAETGWYDRFGPILLDRRFWALVVLTITINQTWHFLRVWLPLCLQDHYGYTERQTFAFTTAYYVATDAGSLTSGFVALWLVRRGVPVHRSRVVVFAACTALAALTVAAAYAPTGPITLGLLLLIGFGSLGLFPVYYSLSQELTVRHQGKLTGVLGFSTWVASALMHPLVGRWLDRTGNWSLVLAVAGLAPLLGLAALLLLWRPIGKNGPRGCATRTA